ncbi:MAG: hypothetical protein KGZ82_13185 [Bacteroidales bacterium]|nr:hypothetical protein [Bacteroidales bacterium]
MSFKENIFRNLSNIPGWRTNRKIIVFESDDWGSVRIPSNEVRNVLIKGDVLTSNSTSHYYLYDSLESNDDLTSLFETLSKYKDFKGNHPAFTAINVVANPDFDKIKQDSFQTYYYEPFTETLNRYPKHDQVHNLWKEGYEKNLFVPQFHGREHINIAAWMKALKEGKPKTLLAFDHGVSGINPVLINESKMQYQAAFDIESIAEISYLKSVIKEGTALFETLMGYRATYFVPTNGPFNLSLEGTLKEVGIKYLMLDKMQKEPLGNGKYKTHIRWLGKRNKHGQIALSRNAGFEPAEGSKDWVSSCLYDIEFAFRWKKPATISTHRVNYIGFLEPKNRIRSLELLEQLISKILKKWPDVEFMTSNQLGDLISERV